MDLAIKEHLLKSLNENSELYLEGYQHSRKYKKSYLSSFEKGLTGRTSCYFSYGVTQGRLDHFHYAVPSKDLAKEFVAVLSCHQDNHLNLGAMKKVFSQMMAAYPKRKHLVIGVHPHQKDLERLVKKLKPKLIACEVLGRPRDGLKYLSSNKGLEDITIRKVNFKNDGKDIMALEIKAHKSDKSSRINIFNKKFRDELTEHHQNMDKIGSSFVAVKNKKVVGVIGTYPQKPIALLATISIDPKFQGQGISKALYKAALEDLRSRRCPFYKGMTTTENVLSQMERMGRKVSSRYYEIDWSKV